MKNSDPAFPVNPNAKLYEKGMTLRDWFATHASEEDIKYHLIFNPGERVLSRETIKYRYANAMMEARKK
ncbi:MAG TPA: hypothetical protein ENH82_00785 [bacterium]|nr:hypothetical protein [bacterium]